MWVRVLRNGRVYNVLGNYPDLEEHGRSPNEWQQRAVDNKNKWQANDLYLTRELSLPGVALAIHPVLLK